MSVCLRRERPAVVRREIRFQFVNQVINLISIEEPSMDSCDTDLGLEFGSRKVRYIVASLRICCENACFRCKSAHFGFQAFEAGSRLRTISV